MFFGTWPHVVTSPLVTFHGPSRHHCAQHIAAQAAVRAVQEQLGYFTVNKLTCSSTRIWYDKFCQRHSVKFMIVELIQYQYFLVSAHILPFVTLGFFICSIGSAMFDSFVARVEMHEVGSSVGLVCCSTMQYVGTAGGWCKW